MKTCPDNSKIPNSIENIECTNEDSRIAGSVTSVVAFYLPQFHSIPENDAWWGKGFTEWTNVTKALPLFQGHRQPRVPSELGYYDLTDDAVLSKQAELARSHGIKGFCYYYYYFGVGKRLLEMPVDRLLKSAKPDFPFCLCWANENWTRAWDGGHAEILMSQGYGEDDIEGFARSVIPFFLDSRYIRIGEKPLLLIYNTRAIPETRSTLNRFREIWQSEAGIEVYIAAALTFGESDPIQMGADSAVEFPPHNVRNINLDPASVGLGSDFPGQVWDYHSHVIDSIKSPDHPFPCFPTVVTDWDNTPRRGKKGSLFVNSNPVAYHNWLLHAIRRTQRCQQEDSRFVFINAWNEWAEGTYLEPDSDNGIAYLLATKSAVNGEDFAESILCRMTRGETLLPEESRIVSQVFAKYREVFSESDSPIDSWFAGFRERIATLNKKLTEFRAKVARERTKKEKNQEKANLERKRREVLERSITVRALKPLINAEKGLRKLFQNSSATLSIPPSIAAPDRLVPRRTEIQNSFANVPQKGLNWTSETVIGFPNTSVRLAIDDDLRSLESNPTEFVLGKSQSMVKRLATCLDELLPERIVDIGVFKGGSAVFLNEYCVPKKLVAIERNPLPCEPLSQYIESGSFGDSVSIYYGVDQADLTALEECYGEEFGSDSVDLVIDDASHFLFETRESFRFLFPRLRPGGIYIIEDWGWAHWPEDYWQKKRGGDYFDRKDPLSNLILELMLLAASAPDVVENIWLDRGQVLVRRGNRKLDSPFNPETLILNRGDRIPFIPGIEKIATD